MHATLKQINTINKLLSQNYNSSLSNYIIEENTNIDISTASFMISILLGKEDVDKQDLVNPFFKFREYFTFIG